MILFANVIDEDMPRSHARDQCDDGTKVGASLPAVGRAELDAWPHAGPATVDAGANA